MGTRLFIALAALGAFIGLVAVQLFVDSTDEVHAADVASVFPGATGPSTAAGVESIDSLPSRGAKPRFKATEPIPDGYGVLIVKALLRGEPYDRVTVTVRGDSSPRRAREDTEPWAYFLPSKSPTFLDVTDEESGWTQTETTLAPVAGDVRTVTVDLNPPEIDGEIQLQVRSRSDDMPVKGARVVAISDDPPDVVVLTTDGRGSVRVPRGPSFSYIINASGHRPATLDAFTDSMKPFQVVELDAQARLFGTLLSQDHGTAQIKLLTNDLEAKKSRLEIASATVDQHGAWAIEGINIPKGEESIERVWLEVQSSGTSRSLKSEFRIEPGMNLEVTDPWIDGIPITLEFVYPSGKPVSAGSPVFLRREAKAEVGAGQTLGGVTDAQGRIAFPALGVSQWACEIGPVKIPALDVTGDSLQTILVEGFDCIEGNVRWNGPGIQSADAARVLLTIGLNTKIKQLGSPRLVQGQPQARFRFDFLPVSSKGTLTAHSGDTSTANPRFERFHSGGPIDVAPGEADVTITMVPSQDPIRVKIQRRSGGVPILNFDK